MNEICILDKSIKLLQEKKKNLILNINSRIVCPNLADFINGQLSGIEVAINTILDLRAELEFLSSQG